MKEDILEQLVDDYMQFKGYFTVHNVKFKPTKVSRNYIRRNDSVPSDVDIIGFNPKCKGSERVWVVSCKAWQKGFSPKSKLRSLKQNRVDSGREAWKGFRELVVKKWADALVAEIKRLTGMKRFTYITAVTKLNGNASNASEWEHYPTFRKNLHRNPIKILTLDKMLTELYEKTNTEIASSEVGRLLQVIKASGWQPRRPARR